MTKLETIISKNPELVKAAVREYLSKHHCPREFGLPECDDCSIKCTPCWNNALDDGRDEE